MNLLKSKYLKKVKNNYLNLINEEFINKDSHYRKTLALWGKNLHKKNIKKNGGFDSHFNYGDGINSHIEKVLKEYSIGKNYTNYLEIGCGQGIDLRYVLNNFNKY